MTDWRSAPISPKLQAMLGFLEKLTRTPMAVTSADLAPVRAVGVTDQAIEDAIYICTAFNLIDRVADSFGFAVPLDDTFAINAKTLLKRGYEM